MPADLKVMVTSKVILFNTEWSWGLRFVFHFVVGAWPWPAGQAKSESGTSHGMGVPGEGWVLKESPLSWHLGGLLRHSNNGFPWCGYYRSNQLKFLPHLMVATWGSHHGEYYFFTVNFRHQENLIPSGCFQCCSLRKRSAVSVICFPQGLLRCALLHAAPKELGLL